MIFAENWKDPEEFLLFQVKQPTSQKEILAALNPTTGGGEGGSIFL